MKSFHIRPSLALRPYIDRLWGWESSVGEPVQLPTLLPGTGAELYFHYGQPFDFVDSIGTVSRSEAGHLVCLRGTTMSLLPNTNIGFIAVRFKVGMLGRFTPMSAASLIDQPRSAETIWGAAANQLIDQLMGTQTQVGRLRLIQKFLIERLQQDSTDGLIEQAMQQQYRARGALSIDNLAAKAGLGRRQFERRWKSFSAQTPQDTQGLCRFQHTVRRLALDPSAQIVDAILLHGYYDQAHFIHDFGKRVGLTPKRFIQALRDKTHFYNTSLA